MELFIWQAARQLNVVDRNSCKLNLKSFNRIESVLIVPLMHTAVKLIMIATKVIKAMAATTSITTRQAQVLFLICLVRLVYVIPVLKRHQICWIWKQVETEWSDGGEWMAELVTGMMESNESGWQNSTFVNTFFSKSGTEFIVWTSWCFDSWSTKTISFSFCFQL